MSVLNIVMQLRKCCNHPNLFEPRPILSPFVMQRITVTLPSILLNICQGLVIFQVLTLLCICSYTLNINYSYLARICSIWFQNFRKDLEKTDVLDLFEISPSCGSLFAYSEGRRLAINEQMLNDYLSNPVDVPMPNVEGFHFSRPPPVSTILFSPSFVLRKFLFAINCDYRFFASNFVSLGNFQTYKSNF